MLTTAVFLAINANGVKNVVKYRVKSDVKKGVRDRGNNRENTV